MSRTTQAGAVLRTHLTALLAADERPPHELARLINLLVLFAELGPPPDVDGMFDQYPHLHARFLHAARGSDPELAEERFHELYCHVHGFEAPYTPAERAQVNATGGYWCHAGGLSPLIKAEPWIHPATVSADFGAGNGLQGLLLQKLYPHARATQVEISSRMVAAGKELQRWLGIPADRVEWRIDDVRNVSPRGLDFVYLYRPLKPVGPGVDFYRQFAADLAASPQEVVIFSIADCLGEYLSPAFERFYDDGHLKCFRGPRG